jgi:hypothetical protein
LKEAIVPAYLCRILAILLACAVLSSAQEKRRFDKKWVASVAALTAANFFDAYTSRNMGETNPFLRGSDGGFNSTRGVGIKFAATGGFLAVQYLLLRKTSNPGMNRTFTITNGVLTGVVGGVAIHNNNLRTDSPTATPAATQLPAYLPRPNH